MLAAPDDMATDPRPVPFSGFAELTSLDDPLRQAIAAASCAMKKRASRRCSRPQAVPTRRSCAPGRWR